jgi:two-component system, OmpR family, sensor histidine kinase KdpD
MGLFGETIGSWHRRWQRSRYGLDYLRAVGITAACTAVLYPVSEHVALTNIVLIYLLGAALAGLWLGRGPSALAAVSNILAFDYFFVPPVFSFDVLDSSYLVTFGVMLSVALIIANLMIAVRVQTASARSREQHTAALYAIARDLAIARDGATMIAATGRHIGDALQCYVTVLTCDEQGRMCAPLNRGDSGGPNGLNMTAAQWVVTSRERAGAGTLRFVAERATYLPLRGSHATIGVLVAEPAQDVRALVPEQYRLLEAIADQLALALERERMGEAAHRAHLAAERAALRNTLLASISHDLRTPLSAIAGAGSIVAQNDFALDIYRRVTLGRLIEDKARDMSDLLTNVLELVRLESGADVLNKDWHTIGELVDMAIQRHESRLSGWRVVTDLSSELPLLLVDANLLVQLLSNLLDNAIKYTPPTTRIQISASADGPDICLVVEDSGPGFRIDDPAQLFEKFARAPVYGNSGGVGLGLAICRAVTSLHGGSIHASSSPLGGARFVIQLPLALASAGLATQLAEI